MGFVQGSSLWANPKYPQYDWHEKHVQQVEEFLEQHHYLAVLFDQLKLTSGGK